MGSGITVATCPFATCKHTVEIRLADPIDGATRLREHLQREYAYGRELLRALGRVMCEPVAVELLQPLPYPAVGDTGPVLSQPQHAASPGVMTLDGYAAALCVPGVSVRLELTPTGAPVRAVQVWHGVAGTAAPRCRRCRNA
ncbi:hypothetical protein [Phytoactinopolyspora endophytica]|uniref:hypothetical protein n=1 Tax=Phytoactinopolyspora endophytica TaxID=1642495 RepID=UPI00101D6BBD|nr:hypothetical protein [Phytoactinopolyspora endophytica]